jgi:ribonucleoside-triphosphate reductase
VRFGIHDPLVPLLRAANYNVFNDPYSTDAVLATFPVSWEDVDFTEVNGVEVNVESAIEQLERYKLLMDNYVDHNCSITISYDPSEVPAIIEWLRENWDHYVGVSFIYRNDPTKTAADLGYPYLPQEVVTKEVFDAYASTLLPVDLDSANTLEELEQDGCATGACPIR